MTKKAVEENENIGKLDWDVMNGVLKNTVNLDDEGKSCLDRRALVTPASVRTHLITEI